MVRASAYPTVEWLARSSGSSVARSGRGIGKDLRPSRNIPSSALADLLRKWSRSTARIAVNTWIRTPNGEEMVDVVIERRRRRVGIRFANRYERDGDHSDALVLVYGRFDAIYRVSDMKSGDTAADIAYAILSAMPNWFSAEGRIAAGRAASAEALLHADRLVKNGALRLTTFSVRRIRLSRASDWVQAFERALSPPPLATFARSAVQQVTRRRRPPEAAPPAAARPS